MKFLLVATLTLFSIHSFADHHDKMGKMHEKMNKKWESMSFEDAKKHMSEKLDTKMKMNQEAKTCVDNSKNKEELKKCKEDMKSKMNEMHEEHMEKMKEMKAKKKK